MRTSTIAASFAGLLMWAMIGVGDWVNIQWSSSDYSLINVAIVVSGIIATVLMIAGFVVFFILREVDVSDWEIEEELSCCVSILINAIFAGYLFGLVVGPTRNEWYVFDRGSVLLIIGALPILVRVLDFIVLQQKKP